MASEADNLKSLEVQAFYCRKMDAPVTTRIVEALPVALDRTTHAHGAWVERLSPPYETHDYVMRATPMNDDRPGIAPGPAQAS